jgi:hypothetical protein
MTIRVATAFAATVLALSLSTSGGLAGSPLSCTDAGFAGPTPASWDGTMRLADIAGTDPATTASIPPDAGRIGASFSNSELITPGMPMLNRRDVALTIDFGA